jgi:hypothetical protein
MTRAMAWSMLFAAAGALGPVPARAYGDVDTAGGLVGVSVEVAGRTTALYPAPDGSARHYLEACEGARYAVTLTNRTRERLGVVLTVDGLNVVSGQRDLGRGRMYVLAPFEQTTVRGWRSSLAEVRQFTFVDERASYATRSGLASGRMGWIEVAVYREERPWVASPCGRGLCDDAGRDRFGARQPQDRVDAAESPDAPAAASPMPEGRAKSEADAEESRPAAEGLRRAPAPRRNESFPGTGWGDRAYDPVTVVDFRAQAGPAERTTLRYEYARSLRALGILPRPAQERDRLAERERGSLGFAPPPRY